MLARIKNVEIFSTGRHRDQEYTHRDLADIADNFRRFSWGKNAKVRPPLVVGHEEDQSLMDNSGIPKMGGPDSVWVETVPCRLCRGNGRDPQSREECQTCLGTGKQGILKANLAQVPEKLARLINARAYDSVSSEIYPEPPEGVPGGGKMLRRIALLGGELPHLKNLKELPWADYEEYGESQVELPPIRRIVTVRLTKVLPSRDGCCFHFSEIKTMSRNETIAKLHEAIDAMPDDELAALLESIGGGDDDEGDTANESRQEKLAKYADDSRGDARKLYTQGTMSFGGEEAKVAKHYDAHAAKFSSYGTTKQSLLNAYKYAEKNTPGMTADKFLTVKDR